MIPTFPDEYRQGRLIVITGPSGVGKTTAVKALQKELDFDIPVSYTTRSPREGETDGLDYHFVDEDTFKTIQLVNGFLETAEFNGNMYGTSRDDVRWSLDSGQNVLLDLDIQGVKSVKELFPDSIAVFMTAPNDREWERRLRGRGSETEESIQSRMAQGRADMREYSDIIGENMYICCTDVPSTVSKLRAIISGDCTTIDHIMSMTARSALEDSLKDIQNAGIDCQEQSVE